MASLEEIAQMAVDSFNNRTFYDDSATYVAENCVSVDEPTGMELHGVEGNIQSSDIWVQAFPDAHAHVVSHDVDGNVVTTTIHATGTFTGEMMLPDGTSIPGNGSTLDFDYVQIAEFEGDKMVRVTARYDMNNMMAQLGLA